jgi:hypothetical protein
MDKKVSAHLFHLPTFYKFLFVIFIGVLIFSAGRKEVGNSTINETLLFIYSIAKTIYFFILLFDRIKDTADHQLDYKDILTFIGYHTLLIVISYGIDYLCLYEIDQHSFTGITTRSQFIPHVVVFFYFSVATFSTAGFGDIAPHSIVAQLLISSEMMLSWFLTILVIANFSSIRDTFRKSSKNKQL